MGLSDGELQRLRDVLGDDTFAGRFAIETEAGSGGMGIVYRAIDRGSGRAVAIKVLTDSGELDHARFAAEAEILERMAHPAIVAYAGHGVTTTGRPYLAMAWLDGQSLANRLRGGPLPIAEAVTIGARVAAALAHAHAQDIVHRDVKPSNVMLVDGKPEHATLIDFGVAKDLKFSNGLTFTGQLVGTPSYMAPEQAIGTAKLDGRVDLFALGCLLYECVTGAPPFEGGELLEVLAKLLLHDPPRLRERRPEVPPRLDALVAALLAKEPENRLADAATAARELETLETAMAAGDDAVLASTTIAGGRPLDGHATTIAAGPIALGAVPQPRRRIKIAIGVGVAALAIAGVTAGAFLTGSSDEPVANGPEACLGATAEGCRAACTSGDGSACRDLGHAVALHSSVEADRVAGIQLMLRGCELGDGMSCTLAGAALETLRRTGSKAFPATAWEDAYDRGCELGRATACAAHATRLDRSYPKDPSRIIGLYERACRLGNVAACTTSGDKLETGRDGVVEDQLRALVMFQIGCELRHLEACERASRIARMRAGITGPGVRPRRP